MHSYAGMFIRRHTPTHGLLHAFARPKFVYGIHEPAKEHTHTHTMIGPIVTFYTLCTMTTPRLYTSTIMWESIWPWGEREAEREGEREREDRE